MKRRAPRDQGDFFRPWKRRVRPRANRNTLPPDAPVAHVVSLSGGRDSGALGIWVAREYEAGRISGPLFYVYVHVGNTMEPETLAWLLMYEARVLTPRGLALEILQGTRGERRAEDGSDPWFDFYAAPGRAAFLPSPLWRTCTEKLKVVPMGRWRRRELAGFRVVWIIGFRADEAKQARRLTPERLAEGPNDELWHPFLALGYGLADVARLLAEEGVHLPDVYEWSDRSGCIVCFFKSKRQIVESARRYPVEFDRMADHEERVIARAGRNNSAWVIARGATLRELVAAAETDAAAGTAQLDAIHGALDSPGYEWGGDGCDDPRGVCSL